MKQINKQRAKDLHKIKHSFVTNKQPVIVENKLISELDPFDMIYQPLDFRNKDEQELSLLKY